MATRRDFLLSRLAFYESYHGNPWNKAIHVICVPLIAWSILVWLHPIKAPLLDVDGAMALVGLYAIGYTVLDIPAGLSWAVCVGYPLYYATAKVHEVSEKPGTLALVGLVVGLWLQVHVGHMMFEKCKPAFVDAFFEALLTAPLFVWLEVLFLFGYDKDMQATVCAQARKHTKARNKMRK